MYYDKREELPVAVEHYREYLKYTEHNHVAAALLFVGDAILTAADPDSLRAVLIDAYNEIAQPQEPAKKARKGKAAE